MNLLLWRLLFVSLAASNIPSQQTGHPQRQGYQSPLECLWTSVILSTSPQTGVYQL